MSKWTRFVPAAMIVLCAVVTSSIPSTTSTVAIDSLTLVQEVRPTLALAAGTRHANHKTHKDTDPTSATIGGGAARPLPQVSL